MKIALGRVAVLIAMLGGWEALSRVDHGGLVPAPREVVLRLLAIARSGELATHLWETLSEALGGFACGTAVALVLAWLVGRHSLIEDALSPLLVALMSIPKVALTPLAFLWLGIGVASKVALVATAVFFPVFFGVLAGLKAIDAGLLTSARVMGARGAFLTRTVILPSVVPAVVTSFKVAVPHAITIAVVAELVASSAGLGYYIRISAAQADIVGMFAGAVCVSLLVILVNGALACIRMRERVDG